MTISVVIPAYNAQDSLPRLLQSLEPNPNIVEVIVVDDASTDATVKTAESFPWVKLLKQEKNKGVAAARNRGGKIAKGEILLFLDADVVCFPDTAEATLESYKDKQLAACSGIIVLPASDVPFCPRYKGIRTYVYWMLENRGGKYNQPFGNACGSVRREIFLKMGGFDESFTGASLEDSEFGSRLVAAGYKVGFNPKIRIKHRFEDFLPMIKKYIHRSKVWTRLFLYKRSFASAGMTRRESINGMLAACVIPFLGLGLLGIKLGWLGTLGTLEVHLALARRFYMFVYKEAGIIFVLLTVPLQLFLYTIIYLAAAYAVIEMFLERMGLKFPPRGW